MYMLDPLAPAASVLKVRRFPPEDIPIACRNLDKS